jgi:DNA-binding transcriptional regulator YdaS (Cro superfamily)
MPSEYVGGLGEAGVRALGQFVEAGGTLVAFNRASALPIESFDLPVVNVLAGLDSLQFYVPGSILRLRLKPGHWLSEGTPSRTIAWFEKGLAFEVRGDDDGRVEMVGRYGDGDPLLSGWMNGAQRVAGKGALAVVRYGQGRVILFGFRPQYRGQTIATYPLIFNVLRRATVGPPPTDSSNGGF